MRFIPIPKKTSAPNTKIYINTWTRERMKRGSLEINQIILFLIALVVLITVVYIFRSQISQFLSALTGIETGIYNKAPSIDAVVGS